MFILFAASMVLLSGIALLYWTIKHLNNEIHKQNEYINDPTPESFNKVVIMYFLNIILRMLPVNIIKGILVIFSIGLIFLSAFFFSLLQVSKLANINLQPNQKGDMDSIPWLEQTSAALGGARVEAASEDCRHPSSRLDTRWKDAQMPLVPLASRDERHFVYLVTVELGIQCKVKTRCKIRAKFSPIRWLLSDS